MLVEKEQTLLMIFLHPIFSLRYHAILYFNLNTEKAISLIQFIAK